MVYWQKGPQVDGATNGGSVFEGHERDVALLRAAHGMSRKWPEKPSGMTVGAECVHSTDTVRRSNVTKM